MELELNEELDLIRITHYINPHMFWYKYEDSFFRNPNLTTWERGLQEHFAKMSKFTSTKTYKPQINEVVAVYNFAFNRWIRAKCDSVLEFTISKPKYVFWAIDYGIPFQSEDQWVRRLPANIDSPPDEVVFFGGVNSIIPAEKEFNFDKLRSEIIPCGKWSELAVRTIENLIFESAHIKFVRDFQAQNGQYFGALVFTTHTNQTIRAGEILVGLGHALKTDDLNKNLRQIGTNQISRWNMNEGSPFVLKFNANKPNCPLKFDNRYSKKISRQFDLDDSVISSDVVQKITDWAIRNERCHVPKVGDSASVCGSTVGRANRSITEEDSENISGFEDQPVMLHGGTKRDGRLKKYQQSIPPPPAELEQSNEDTKSIPYTMLDDDYHPTENSRFDYASENSIKIDKWKLRSGSKSSSSNIICETNDQTDAKLSSESAQLLCADEESEINTDSFESGKIEDNLEIEEENSEEANAVVSESAMNLVLNRIMNKRRMLRNKMNNQRKTPQKVIPAGFDLRNLQNVKEPPALKGPRRTNGDEQFRIGHRNRQPAAYEITPKRNGFPGFTTEACSKIDPDEQW